RSVYLSTRLPFGLPKCDIKIVFAPCSRSQVIVGSDARIRVSSVSTILPSRASTGTLKSTRTRTRFPRTSRSCRVSFMASAHAPARARARNRDRINNQAIPPATHRRGQRTCVAIRRAFRRYVPAALWTQLLSRRSLVFEQSARQDRPHIPMPIRAPFQRNARDLWPRTSHYLPRYLRGCWLMRDRVGLSPPPWAKSMREIRQPSRRNRWLA